jgi:hypothetical protein
MPCSSTHMEAEDNRKLWERPDVTAVITEQATKTDGGIPTGWRLVLMALPNFEASSASEIGHPLQCREISAIN